MHPYAIALIALALTILALVGWIVTLEKRLRKLLTGKNAATLEDTITAHGDSILKLFDAKTAIDAELRSIDARMQKKIQGAKTKRFNPFAGTGTGGNQSFATALLDENGDGVVLSTLYSREKVSIFAKPIKQRTSEFELTEEEKEVLS